MLHAWSVTRTNYWARDTDFETRFRDHADPRRRLIVKRHNVKVIHVPPGRRGLTLFAVRRLVDLPDAVLPVICPVRDDSGILSGLKTSYFEVKLSSQVHREDRKCTHDRYLFSFRVQ